MRGPRDVSRETWQEIRAGLADTWTVGLGLIPLGLAFGMLMVQSGYAWWWTPIFSLVIYAGSMEFLAINLVSSGIGPLSAALTGFMVNFRHIFYGLTFPRDAIPSAAARAYSTYALTDESYAVVSAHPPGRLGGVRVLTIQALCQVLWVVPGILGALLGQVIPADIEGMDFALTALFIVLAWESFRNNRDASLPLVAGTLAVAAALVVPGQMLMAALALYFFILVVRFRWRESRGVTPKGDK
ncbi:AzlC family ABC transporter permease [Corynebacterium sp. zg-331]|uniref:AzlC family ABC transporter permease n=1 Tax=unclassified Corynebacterium TaxID=2624378 RepID=UPI00128C1899|nr:MULTISPECIES: AzlC family ABC transporter permease [unclassified Corynebacterium]MBC3186498.1 AzlC family ABC transporter permease [Corynebacterium sp. zg-331]MPV52983.1 branched-chain amino acid ABC transporter permease [Corynebacterium sp. zg331]